MKGFREDAVRERPEQLVTEEDYIRFFEKKWEAIVGYLELEYRQKVEGDWIVFTVSTWKAR